ncbi:MAG: cobalamin-dependent protein [Deltaproteobacteria bacterium]|nr:MAG: cobalamin-dependent protein [Deltaproteobacteria bacterium]
MYKKIPNILLVNPWIYDFAAYDLWSKPLGLLLLAGFLRDFGYNLRLLDCLDVHDSRMKEIAGVKPATRRAFGAGKFYRMEVEKPAALANIDRTYYRFGITPEIFQERLLQGAEPDVILMTSTMTYWYPGVQETTRLLKAHFPRVPIVLGGIYATLCREHAARHSGADHVISGPAESRILEFVEKLTGHRSHRATRAKKPQTLPWPAYDLMNHLDYVCVLTSRGCPYHCPYCASDLLYPDFVRRNPNQVVNELEHWYQLFEVVDVAFYDDALLVDAGNHLLPMLAEIRARDLPLRFHTPNGMHLSVLSAAVCQALHDSCFKTVRLGLETADPGRQQKMGGKVKSRDFSAAMDNLTRAGFSPDQIGVYLLCGLPGQDPAEVSRSIRVVQDHGARPHLAEYSPIPGTRFWPEALRCSPYDIAGEPLFHNNSLLSCQSERFGFEELQRLKQLCRE